MEKLSKLDLSICVGHGRAYDAHMSAKGRAVCLYEFLLQGVNSSKEMKLFRTRLGFNRTGWSKTCTSIKCFPCNSVNHGGRDWSKIPSYVCMTYQG